MLVEGASDGLAKAMAEALAGWRAGDGVLVVTAGALTAKSALRVAFEKAPNAVAVGIYDDPPSRAEIAAMVAQAGLGGVDEVAMGELTTLAQEVEPGDFRQTLEKLALYKLGDDAPLSPAEILALAPNAGDTDELDLAAAVARRRGAADRAADPPAAGAGQAAGGHRDPGAALFPGAACHRRGPRRAVGGGAQGLRLWQPARQDGGTGAGAGRRPSWKSALAQLIECDLTLRSTSRAPTMALVERALVRIAVAISGAHMTELVLIGHRATRTFRVIWMLEELGQDYTLHEARPHSEDVQAENPSGKVPVLMVDGDSLTNSTAIMTFLTDRPSVSPGPAAAIERARQDGLTHLVLDEFDAVLWVAGRHSYVSAGRAAGAGDQGIGEMGIRAQPGPAGRAAARISRS